VALAPDNTDLLRVYADALLAAGRSEEVPPVLEAGLRDQFSEGSPERAAIKQRISQLPVPDRPH
jgi:cytochrome c-type biogenesis protein CcmH